MQFFVKAEWDEDAHVWYVAESDVPGLATEAPTLDALQRRVLDLLPILVEENAHLISQEHGSRDLVRLCVESSFSIERARAV